jgi:phosphatidate cytidylyltransferase
MKKPGKRTITGAVFGGVMLAALFAGKEIAALVFLALTILSVYEFLKIHSLLKHKLTAGTIVFLSIIAFAFVSDFDFIPLVEKKYILIVVFPWIAFIVSLLSQKNRHIEALVSGLVCPVLIAVPFGFVTAMYSVDFDWNIPDFAIPLSLFIFIWMNDMFAYFIGKAIGRTPLIPIISPGKTIEGTIGGMLMTVISGLLMAQVFQGPGILFWTLFAIIASLSSIIGDLAESSMKRRLGIKDSGSILPGHGGFLDRFDSLFMAATFIYIFLIFWS